MNKYRVTWTIDTEAESEREAAEYALNVQRDPESIATVFDVYNDEGSDPVRIDLTPQE
jgi:hypothetical protein